MKKLFGRIRKALSAGFGAGLGAAITALLVAGKVDSQSVGQALGALIIAGVPVGWATWRIPNDKKKDQSPTDVDIWSADTARGETA